MSLKKILIRGILLTVPYISVAFQQQTSDTTGWERVPLILQSIIPPQFPDSDFSITSFGAVGDGVVDCTNAFADAIDSCANAGGGRVVVPDGTYLTGAIHLRSNVNLYVAKNATIKFSTDSTKYLPVVLTRFESVECMNYSPLIYALDQENIAVTGEGVLDGQGAMSNWWRWKNIQTADRNALFQMGENGTAVNQRVFGDGHLLRPNFIQPYRCKNVLIQGVTFKNSPMWFINPVLCENVSIINVTTEGFGPNNDGCDPECSKNVLIKGCTFNTGDDCIAIKSGRNNDGRRVNVASEDIVIQNCRMKEGHGGVTMGSETSGSIRNVYAENDTMDSPNLQRALRFKTNSVRGGTIENIYARNLVVNQVSNEAIIVDFYYEEGDAGNFAPVMRNLNVENMVCKRASYALRLMGYPRSPITNVLLKDCTFTNISNSTNITQNVVGLHYDNVTINGVITSVEKEKKANVLPNQFELKQNYPNPFNPSTTISYTVPEKTFVTGMIYSILGQEVQILVHEEKQPGSYYVEFNGDNLPSGVYFCRFRAGDFVATRKLVLMK
jgi:hypothetical protein